MKENIKLLRAVIKSRLNNTELSILCELMSRDEKTITATYTALSVACNMKQNNFSRDINSMILKNVIGKRGDGIFIKATSSWCKK